MTARVARAAVVFALAAVLAPTTLARPAEAAGAGCAVTVTAETVRACVDAARTSYVLAWRPALEARGVTVVEPTTRLFRAFPANPCIPPIDGDVAVASFWCDENRTVYVARTAAPYWTREYARDARRQGVLASDARRAGTTERRLLRGFPLAGAATELAHELGHWVQEQTGLDDWYRARIESARPHADRYASAIELSADCLAGWVQARTEYDGTWRGGPIVRWAEHATIAELGGLGPLRPGFTYAPDRPILGHGSAHERLAMYDAGRSLARTGREGILGCARAAATLTRTALPTPLIGG